MRGQYQGAWFDFDVVDSGVNPRSFTAAAPSGRCSVSSGVTVSPSSVVLGQNFNVSFTIKETQGYPKTFENVKITILNSNNADVFDFATYSNVAVSANGTWSKTATNYLYTTQPAGTYKAIVRGQYQGAWFDFDVVDLGVNPRSFTAAAPSGYCSVSSGVTVSPSSVVLGQNFNISFTIKERYGYPKTFDNVKITILNSNGADVFDFATYSNVPVSANGTWSRTATNQLFTTNPAGTYKAIVRGQYQGTWFDFDVVDSGVNPRSFTAAAQQQGTGDITGRLRIGSASGTYLSGAAVTCGGKPATTSYNGTYTITGIAPGSQTLSFSKTGYEPYSKTVTITAGQTLNAGDNYLVANATTGDITGTLRIGWLWGAPLAGASVTCGGKSTTTATDGSYTITDIAPGSQTLSFFKTGYQTYEKVVTVTAGKTLNAWVNYLIANSTTTIPGGSTLSKILLTTSWSQYAPDSSGYCQELKQKSDPYTYFYDSNEDGTEEEYVVGCTAVAVGQLINYYFQKGYRSGWLEKILEGVTVYPRFQRNGEKETSVKKIYCGDGYITESHYAASINDRNDEDAEKMREFLWNIALGLDSKFIELERGVGSTGAGIFYLFETPSLKEWLRWILLQDAMRNLLIDRFRFNNTIKIKKLNRLDREKDDIIKSINEGIPILMTMDGDNGGHAVIIDGYRVTTEGAFEAHINMGWANCKYVDGTQSNNYYKTDGHIVTRGHEFKTFTIYLNTIPNK